MTEGKLVLKHVILSLLANRMANVWASGSPSLTSAAAFHTQLLSLPTFGSRCIFGTTATQSIPVPYIVTMIARTVVVGTNFQCFVSPHNQPRLRILLVLEQSHVAGTTLLPFSAVAIEPK